jgi:hypothetical protein
MEYGAGITHVLKVRFSVPHRKQFKRHVSTDASFGEARQRRSMLVGRRVRM